MRLHSNYSINVTHAVVKPVTPEKDKAIGSRSVTVVQTGPNDPVLDAASAGSSATTLGAATVLCPEVASIATVAGSSQSTSIQTTQSILPRPIVVVRDYRPLFDK